MIRIVEGDKDYITLRVLAAAIATYVGFPMWVWLATDSPKWGVFTFIVIAFWLNDLLVWPKRKKKNLLTSDEDNKEK